MPSPSGPPGSAYKAAITKEGKSIRTIADYQDKFDRHLKAWHDRPLASIKREDVVQEHAAVTERARQARAGQKYSSGKYAANGTMRFAPGRLELRQGRIGVARASRAQPVPIGKAVPQGEGRNTGMGVADLPAWWAELQALPNPIRRELHLFMLLTGLRRTDVLTARWANFDAARPSLRLPSPKGGEDRAFELPLSPRCWSAWTAPKKPARPTSRGEQDLDIPGAGRPCSRSEGRGPAEAFSHRHALRHSFRTLAAAAGIDRLAAKNSDEPRGR